MTSLAQQLKRLAVPHTQSQLGQDTRKVSLLFDPKEAANFDRETFFALGINGLEELQSIDPSFSEYEETLFNESSMSFERTIQSQEVNERLNESIESFLIKLSPYFLLKPAHKAMEWLIQRYRIHQFNKDELMECIFPYHETKIFVRAVQLLKLDDPANQWHWLQPIQKPGVTLARSTVVNHCYKDPGFMSFVCGLVPKFLRVHADMPNSDSHLRVVMTFCTSTLLGAVDYCGSITENMLSQLLPFLVKGLKSKNLDYRAGTYMIVSQLVTKTTLKAGFLDKLIPVLTKHITLKSMNEAVSCLTVVCQTQRLQKLPRKSFKHLCKVPGIIHCFQHLASQYDITSCLLPFLSRLVLAAVRDQGASMTSSDAGEELSQGPADYSGLLLGILSDVPMETELATSVISILVEEYCVLKTECSHNQEKIEEMHAHMQRFVGPLERRYPSCMDTVIEKKLAEAQNDKKMQRVLQSLVGLTVSGYKHQSIPKSDTSLFLSLNHPKAQIRAVAVKHLLDAARQTEETDSFVKDALLKRLEDDEVVVVETVLEAGEILRKILGEDFLSSVKQVLLRHQCQKKWAVVRRLCLQLLVSASVSDDDQTLLTTVLPFIVALSVKDLATVQLVMQSEFAEQSPLLTKLCTDWLNEQKTLQDSDDSHASVTKLNQLVITSLAASLAAMAPKKMSALVSLLCDAVRSSDSGTTLRWLVMSVLSHLLLSLKKQDAKMNLAIMLIRCIQEIVNDKQTVTWDFEKPEGKNSEDLMSLVANTLRRKSCIPGPAVVEQLKNIISSVVTPSQLQKTKWWTFSCGDSVSDTYLEFCVQIFHLLTSKSVVEKSNQALHFRSLLGQFIKHFPNSVCMYKFLGLMWNSDEYVRSFPQMAAQLSPVLQARALNIASHCLSVEPQELLQQLISDSSTVVPCLVLSLLSTHEPIREMTLTCLTSVLEGCGECDSVYTVLVKKLVNCREELTADPDHLSQAIGVLFMSCFQTENLSPKKRKKMEKKQQIRQCLNIWTGLCVAKETPLYVKKGLLETLKSVNHGDVFESLLPLLDVQLSKEQFTGLDLCVLKLLLKHFTPEVTASLLPSSAGFQLLLNALRKSVTLPGYDAPQIVVLKQISKDFFAGLEDESQQMLLSCLFNLWVDSDNPTLSSAISSALKHLSLKASHINFELKLLNQSEAARTVRQAKRIRRLSQSEEGNVAVVESRPWRRVTLVLEMLQGKKKIKDGHQVVPVLFDIINKCLELQDQSTLDYIKQLLLSCLLHMCERFIAHGQSADKEILSAEQFNIEAVVQCIRSSESPQTHQQALLLLTTAAKLFPDHVLHNIMSIFTFMGANLMRQDDSYSFQVINKTIHTVIPALIKAEENDMDLSKRLEDVVAKVLRVFVDAQPHIPEHRKLSLFSAVVETVGPMRFLWFAVVLMLERHVTHTGVRGQDSQDEKASSGLHADLEFCLSVCHHFPVVVQVSTCRKIIKYLATIALEKEEKPNPVMRTPSKLSTKKATQKEEKLELFDVDGHSAKQLKHFRFTATGLITSLLSSEEFIAQVVKLDEDDSLKLPKQYQVLVEESLKYITVVAKAADQHSQDASAKFWRALLHRCYDVLDKINALLPGSLFIEVVSGLMHHDLPMVRRKSMDLLNNKLQQQQFDASEVEALLQMVPQLNKIVKASKQKVSDVDVATNRQTALLSLKILCRMFGQQHPDLFKPVLQETVILLSKKGIQSAVLSSGLLCLAELCTSLQAHTIPYLRQFMPALIDVLTDDKSLRGNELLLLSAVTTVQRVVATLPHFLSPYLQEIILVVTKLSSLQENKDKNQKSQLHIRLNAIRHSLATLLPPRVLLPVFSECYNQTSTENRVALSGLFCILQEHITTMSKEDLLSHNTPLLNFFLLALDYRQTHAEVPLDDIMETEGHVISAVISMVMRLSEVTFRPTFFKLYDWASHNEEYKDRLLVFYRLSDRIADSLKSLFCLFAGHMIQNAADLLSRNNASKTDESFYGDSSEAVEKSNSLLQFILDCLNKIFMYDNEGFLTKERFDTLMQPLVDQIENTLGGDESYIDRIQSHLLPCIGQFAAASANDASWKSLNYQILLKTRHESAKVRFSSLKIIEEVSRKLGDDYMSLLPETIPFLAELMEDESEEVEKLCQEVIAEMEKILGEPLQKYF